MTVFGHHGEAGAGRVLLDEHHVSTKVFRAEGDDIKAVQVGLGMPPSDWTHPSVVRRPCSQPPLKCCADQRGRWEDVEQVAGEFLGDRAKVDHGCTAPCVRNVGGDQGGSDGADILDPTVWGIDVLKRGRG